MQSGAYVESTVTEEFWNGREKSNFTIDSKCTGILSGLNITTAHSHDKGSTGLQITLVHFPPFPRGSRFSDRQTWF